MNIIFKIAAYVAITLVLVVIGGLLSSIKFGPDVVFESIKSTLLYSFVGWTCLIASIGILMGLSNSK